MAGLAPAGSTSTASTSTASSDTASTSTASTGTASTGTASTGTASTSTARIYDYLLGGKDNNAADRLAAGQLLRAARCRTGRQDQPGLPGRRGPTGRGQRSHAVRGHRPGSSGDSECARERAVGDTAGSKALLMAEILAGVDRKPSCANGLADNCEVHGSISREYWQSANR